MSLLSISINRLLNIEITKLLITKYFNYQPTCNTVFSRENLPEIKDGVYVIILDERQSKRTHWLSLLLTKI